jgi:hypothetical protein
MTLPDEFLWENLLQPLIELALIPCHHAQESKMSDVAQKSCIPQALQGNLLLVTLHLLHYKDKNTKLREND